MTRYFAEIENNIVTRVVVCNNPSWLEARLGGTWIETKDPYDLEAATPVTYCSPGYGYDPNFEERFAPQWRQPQGWFDEQGNPQPPDGYPEGALTFHNGNIWRSTTPGNVWEPGVSGWHDSPDSGIADWVQPTGAHDAYALGAEVMHNGIHWVSNYDNNVWEPGVFGWTDIGPA